MTDKRVTMALEGTLSGYEIVVDIDNITLGFFEDLQAPGMKENLDALCDVIVGGRLPFGAVTSENIRQALRKLKPDQFGALATGMQKALSVPKNA